MKMHPIIRKIFINFRKNLKIKIKSTKYYIFLLTTTYLELCLLLAPLTIEFTSKRNVPNIEHSSQPKSVHYKCNSSINWKKVENRVDEILITDVDSKTAIFLLVKTTLTILSLINQNSHPTVIYSQILNISRYGAKYAGTGSAGFRANTGFYYSVSLFCIK